MVELRLTLFGPLRPYGKRTLSLADGATVADARAALQRDLPAAADILKVSAIGTDTEVLSDGALLTSGEYAVLPPVSGG